MAGGTQGGGGKRWGGSTVAPALSPARIFAAADHVLWIEYDHITLDTGLNIASAANKFADVGGLVAEEDHFAQLSVLADALNGRAIAHGSEADRLTSSATWLAANTSWRAYAVLRADTWVNDSTAIELFPMRLRTNTGPDRWSWLHTGTSEEVFSTIGGAGSWVAVRAYLTDDIAIGLGVNNGTVVTSAIAASTNALNLVTISSRQGLTGHGSIDSHAMLVVVRGVPSAADDEAMARYINARFGVTDLPALTWGGAVYAAGGTTPQTGTQGARIKRWAGSGRVPNNQRWAVPFPADGLPPLGIVDDGTGSMIVDTDSDFIMGGVA